MNINDQADLVIATALKGDEYATALRFVECCHTMSALHGTPIEDLVKKVNVRLASRVSRGIDIDS